MAVAASAQPSVPSPAGPRGLRGRLAAVPRAELIAWLVLVAAALAVRLIGLGDRPFHHDESQDAYFSWILRTTGQYAYDPLLHGPLRFYLTSLMYLFFGDSDFTARLAPALMGTCVVALTPLLRPLLGRWAAFAAGALLAFGPSYLYFSRFAREDIYVACLTLALVAVVFRFLERPRPHQPAVAGALLALNFATKETTFITLFVIGSFLLAALALPRTRPLVAAPVRAVGWASWAWGVAAFAAVFTILFTTFLTHPRGLYDGVYTGLKYWLSQHSVHRGGEPPGFYLLVLAGEEWPALLLGAVGAAAVIRRPTLFGAFLIWDFLLSLAIYSWAGEKFAWLVLHPLLPLLLLAGLGLQTIWRTRRAAARWAGLALAALALAYGVAASWSVNVANGADPRELLVSTQSSVQVKQVAEQVLALDRRHGGRLRITVDASQGATFPYAWYFRHLDAGYVDLTTSRLGADADVLILTDEARAALAPALRGYDGRRFAFRVWWVRDYGEIGPATFGRWLLERKVWNPTGGLPEWLYVRKGL